MKIASVGACTAVGLNATSSAAAVRAGISGFGAHPYIVDSLGDRVIVAHTPVIDSSADTSERLATMACVAIREAMLLRLSGPSHGKVPVYLAVPSPRPGLDCAAITSVVMAISSEFALHDLPVEIFEIEAGHAGGLLALQACCAALAQRRCNWAVAGGVDSWLDSDALEWLEAAGRLHNAVNPWGFIPGEGAAFCIVSDSAQPSQGSHATVSIAGFGVADEVVPRRGEEPCLGRGLTNAIQNAIAELPPEQRIDDVFCDYNGEWDRADEYGFAVVRTSDRFVDATATRSPADCWGDVGAATGTLLVSLAWQAAQRHWLAGRNALVWSSSDGPHRAAIRLSVGP